MPDARPSTATEAPSKPKLERNLKERHVQLIALGGTIGVGLFLGSAKAIQDAGPGLILGYAIGGIVIFFIMRALGELLAYRPVTGAFAAYADEFISPFAGFVTGWSYWFMWVVDGMAEVTAIGIYFHYWFPNTPQWIPALGALGLFYGANLLAVRVFGELEFWFASIKVATIIGLILVGLAVIMFGVTDLGPTATFANLWAHGGALPFGMLGVALCLQSVMFAYTGVEMVGVAAGEAKDPAVTLPRAINSIIYRILIFYIGALAIIMSLVPWNQLSATTSPFVLVFERLGVPGAALIMGLVVLTAAASALNSGIYSSARMLYSLASRGQAPRRFQGLNRRHVPAAGVHASAAVMLVGVGLNYVVPEKVFAWVTSVALVGTLWTWAVIMWAHRNYRVEVAAGRRPGVAYRMPGGAVATWIVLSFLALIAGLLAVDPDTRVALYVAPIWFILLSIGFARIARRTEPAPLEPPQPSFRSEPPP